MHRNGGAHWSDILEARGKEPSPQDWATVPHRGENQGSPVRRCAWRIRPHTSEPLPPDLLDPKAADAIDTRMCESPARHDRPCQKSRQGCRRLILFLRIASGATQYSSSARQESGWY